MSNRPQFKRYFRCQVIPSEGVFLLSEHGRFLLRGQAYIHLAPLLNGQHTTEEIIDRLEGIVPAPEIYYALGLLRRKGYIIDAPPATSTAQAAFWDTLSPNPAAVAQRLQATPVSVIGLDNIDPTPFEDNLKSLGLQPAPNGDFYVVLTPNYLHPNLDAINRQALAHNRPWLLVKPVGIELWLGPLVIPPQTGCWACLAHRLQGHRKTESYLQKKQNSSDPFGSSIAALPTTRQTALSLAATEAAKWVALGQNSQLAGKIITLNSVSLEKREHFLVKRPQCPRCGNPSLFTARQTEPLVLQPRPKTFTADGGHRTRSPAETFRRFAYHISPITGVVSALKRTTMEDGADGLLHAYMTDHNTVHMVEDLYFLRESLRSRSGGKGKTDIQAKTSTLCEAIERYAGLFQGDEARVSATLTALGDEAYHPNDLLQISPAQFAQREQWNATHGQFHWIPEPFDASAEIEWSPVWSLTHQATRYVPTAFCYYGYGWQHNIRFIRADSNGCAAGNSREEAILQGFLELVERDAVALWWYNRLKKPAVALSSFDDPYFQQLTGYYQATELWVLDLTSDLGIPTFAAISRRTNSATEAIILGFGAHFEPKLAILRALTELNQFLPAVSSHAKNGPNNLAPDVADWWETATV